jgi:hypothetical protein
MPELYAASVVNHFAVNDFAFLLPDGSRRERER